MYISYAANCGNQRRIIGVVMACFLAFSIGCGSAVAMAMEWEPGVEAGLYFNAQPEQACKISVEEEAALTVAASSEMAAVRVQEIMEQAIQQKAAEEEVKTPLIILDPGHGGVDDGCVRADISEKDINLSIARVVKKKLKQMGYDVMMTREGDEEISLEQRVCFANERQASLYISIHQNSCEEQNCDVKGIETYYCGSKENDGSKRLAAILQKEMIHYTDARDRETVSKEDLYVIRETDMPSCLIETGFLSNRKERELLTTAEYQEQLADAIADSVDLYFHPKTMYLTFDDGPSAENTSAVLDILKERNIKATFFLVGENVEKHPEIAKRIVEEGHTIGIHCNRHEYEEIYASVDAYVADFEEAQRIVYEATGVETKLFRFPGGSINAYDKEVYQDIIEAMTEKGYIYYDWNASLEDAVSKSTPEALVANGVESTLGRKRVVMLAHDVVYNTTLCLDDLIDQFPEYEMLPLSEEVEPIQF